jgi:hypothetical protein
MEVPLSDFGDIADPLALENQVCFALAVASRSVIAVYRPLLEPMGLTHPQYLVMLALWQHAPLSVKELSRLLQLEPATLSPLLKRLETSRSPSLRPGYNCAAKPRRSLRRSSGAWEWNSLNFSISTKCLSG